MSTTEKQQFILGRRSIRAYKPGDVSDKTLQTLLEAAMAAPSAAAKDPWRFVVVRDRTLISQIAEALPNGKMILQASCGVVVCGDIDVAHDRQISYLLQDCSAAIENLLLAAHVHGLGACWLGIHPREDRIQKISALLGLPANIVPVSAIAIGLPAEQKEARTRYNPSFVHQNRWQKG